MRKLGFSLRKPDNEQPVKTIANLANNYALDCCPEGLRRTLRVLSQSKIIAVGAGLNLTEACKPLLVQVRDWRIAFVSYDFVIPELAAATPQHGVAGTALHGLFVRFMRMSALPDLVASYDKRGVVICGTLRACRISCRSAPRVAPQPRSVDISFCPVPHESADFR
jgi:hypothetical protein